MKITNKANLPLPLAVWLVHDDYDYNPDPDYISATSLLRSTKQIVLGKRIPSEDREMDVAELLASSLGTAFHDSVEHAWRSGGKLALKKLGYPAAVYENLVINPTPEQLAENPKIVACYIEQRTVKEIAGFKVGGKFDMILDGRLFDHKSTSVYAYLLGSKDEDYALQMGIYRWLNPDKVLDDHGFINFLFTDWQKSMSLSNPNYPAQRALGYPVLMWSIEKVQEWIISKLHEVKKCWNLPEEQIPPCTDKELWRSEPKYKYYSDPAKMNVPGARATKNFDTKAEADAHRAACGKGAVKTVPGEVKACGYCPAFEICKQKDEYIVQP